LRTAKLDDEVQKLLKSGTLRNADKEERKTAIQKCLEGKICSKVSQDYRNQGIHIDASTLRKGKAKLQKNSH
jgi:hypothetical protein